MFALRAEEFLRTTTNALMKIRGDRFATVRAAIRRAEGLQRTSPTEPSWGTQTDRLVRVRRAETERIRRTSGTVDRLVTPLALPAGLTLAETFRLLVQIFDALAESTRGRTRRRASRLESAEGQRVDETIDRVESPRNAIEPTAAIFAVGVEEMVDPEGKVPRRIFRPRRVEKRTVELRQTLVRGDPVELHEGVKRRVRLVQQQDDEEKDLLRVEIPMANEADRQTDSFVLELTPIAVVTRRTQTSDRLLLFKMERRQTPIAKPFQRRRRRRDDVHLHGRILQEFPRRFDEDLRRQIVVVVVDRVRIEFRCLKGEGGEVVRSLLGERTEDVVENRRVSMRVRVTEKGLLVVTEQFVVAVGTRANPVAQVQRQQTKIRVGTTKASVVLVQRINISTELRLVRRPETIHFAVVHSTRR